MNTKDAKVGSRTNDVTLFSNGIGHFRRVYSVGSDAKEISIPFKRDHIGDVAASLQVFGKVKLNTPPSFTPSNANATALEVNQRSALSSLLQRLSGSTVKIAIKGSAAAETYTLLGTETETVTVESAAIEKPFVVVMSQGTVKRIALDEVKGVEFTEDSVLTEISKALKNNFQLIKPDSSLLDLSISSLEGEAEAVVQYTIPVAAWKMRYAIREQSGKFSLEGAAIIDNNTDEDWNDFKVSVVTGNPISFATDIANVVVPNRKMVRLVDGTAEGNVVVEDAYQLSVCAAGAANPMAMQRSARNLGAKMSTANYASFGLESCSVDAEDYSNAQLAETPGVESKDVGDFCIFTSKEPISILARKSAVVPMFTVPLSAAGVVLFYKESNNARRPYRAIKFKNESEYSLGKGKTTIYNEGVFSGECVLDSTKPGENRMLPHCLENGVRITKETKQVESRRSSVRISEGVAVEDTVYTAETTYLVENKKEESFKLAIEHTSILSGNVQSFFECTSEIKEKEKLTTGSGHRVYVELGSKETLTLTVIETLVTSQEVNLVNAGSTWLRVNVMNPDASLASITTDKNVKACISLQTKLDECKAEIKAFEANKNQLERQIERLRENLSATKNIAASATVDSWIADVDRAEKQIQSIDFTEIPALQASQRKLENDLRNALKKVAVSWNVDR